MKTMLKVIGVLAAFSLAGPSVAAVAAPEAWEKPPLLKASQVLPRELLKGPSYAIEEKVLNDGYLNRYKVRSRFGDLNVVSTALLLTRIDEIRAMEKMEKLQTSEEFGKAVAEGGKKAVTGAVNLVKDPLGSVGSAVSGVGKMFRLAGEGLRSEKSKYEDSTTETLLGIAKAKREYAVQFGVDPYSTNPYLQRRLGEIAEAGQAGGITSTVLKAMIPGGVGAAVSVSSGSNWLQEVDLSQPPSQLRLQNRDKLLKMGVNPSLAEEIVNQGEFSPAQQSMVVAALKAMANVQDKEVFLSLALTTDNQDVALYRQLMSQMYASYHHKVAKLERLVSMGRLVVARSSNGKLVIAFPLDHLVWTQATAGIASFLTEQAKAMGVTEIELCLTGTLSPVTRARLKALGWKTQEQRRDLLRWN